MWGTSGCLYKIKMFIHRTEPWLACQGWTPPWIVQKENKDKYKKMIIMQASDSVLSIKGTVVEDVLTSFT